MREMKSLIRGNRRRRGVPSLNVASMPDLIFTVLFFFMIVTHMRSDEVKVRLEVPAGTEVRKLAGHPAIINIYIGHPANSKDWQVQLNGDFVTPGQIPARIQAIRSKLSPENAERLTVSLRADRRAPMGIISDVKKALQQSYTLKINYSATEINQ